MVPFLVSKCSFTVPKNQLSTHSAKILIQNLFQRMVNEWNRAMKNAYKNMKKALQIRKRHPQLSEYNQMFCLEKSLVNKETPPTIIRI